MASFRWDPSSVEQKFKTQLGGRLRQAFDELIVLMQQAAPSDLLWHWRIGKAVARFRQPDLHGSASAGVHTFDNLARALGCKYSLIEKSHRFSATYKFADAKRLQKGKIPWTSVRHLLSLPVDRRKEFLKKAVKENWNSSQLKLAIRNELGPKRKLSGRKHKFHNLGWAAGLGQLVSMANRWCDYLDDGLRDNILEIPQLFAREKQYPKQLKQFLPDADMLLAKLAGEISQLRSSQFRALADKVRRVNEAELALA